jgi:exopolysaccharide biosynthesis polyprenyl glycosylphosphotransferase
VTVPANGAKTGMHLLASYGHRTDSGPTCVDSARQGAVTKHFERRGPAPARAGDPNPAPPRESPLQLSRGGVATRIRAWMVVPPVDAILLLTPLLWTPQQSKAIVTMAFLALLLVTGGRRYRARLHLSVLDELPALFGRLLIAAALVATVIALRHEQEAVTTFLVNTAICVCLVVMGRVVTTQLIGWGRRHHYTAHRTLLIGGGALSAELARILQCSPRYGLAVAGFVDDGTECVAEAVIPHLGHLNELDRVVGQTGADVLLVADGNLSERYLIDAVRTPACMPCDLLVVPRMHHFAPQTGPGDHIGSIPVIRMRTPNLQGPAWLVKRTFDVVAAALLLTLAAPVIACSALAMRVESGGAGMIFRQTRVGRGGVLFDCLKIRSMRPADETESATNWSVSGDSRVGPVGRFLRRTSLDELPQLWNVLRGEMTLVGPRPERPYFVDRFSVEFERYAHRHRVQAGMTGLAQVSGLRGDTSIADRTRFDNYYIEHWSLWLDIKIVIRTFSEIVNARGR